jgi:CheY-like chemotaxis protein
MTQKILIVDDDTEFRSALALVLEDEGFDVHVEWNGRAALEYMRTHQQPAVVLLDLEMPIMDGQTFCDEKNRDQRVRGIPVVILSAHPDLGDRIRPRGVAEWLRKPVDAAVVLRTVRRLIAESAIAAREVA